MKRRSFVKAVAATVPGIPVFRLPVFGQNPEASTGHRKYTPGNIVNEYTAFLPGEQQALSQKIEVTRILMQYQTVEASVEGEQRTLKAGESIQGWKLLALLPWHNGTPTAVF